MTSTSALYAGFFVFLLALLILYIWHNDKRLYALPESIASLQQKVTSQSALALAEAYEKAGPNAKEEELKRQVPPKTGRRYIVVGGGGFLGGWIVCQLLERGEDPKNIRIIDLNDPVNWEVAEARRDRGLQYIKTNISDYASVEEAFTAPWDSSSTGTTVFHTASNIRFYERHPSFLPRSSLVNVTGTHNIVAASKLIHADILLYTSSASVCVKSTRDLLWPWEKAPRNFVHVIDDGGMKPGFNGPGEEKERMPKDHWDHFSNYAVSKREAEGLVLEADSTPLGDGKGRVLRTGAIRPGNGVYGSRGDMLCGAYLVRGTNPTWVQTVLQSWCYVENCALAHLLYERRLLDLIARDQAPPSSDPSQKEKNAKAISTAGTGLFTMQLNASQNG